MSELHQINGSHAGGVKAKLELVDFKISQFGKKLEHLDELPSISKSLARMARNELVKVVIVGIIIIIVLINDRKMTIEIPGVLKIGQAYAEVGK